MTLILEQSATTLAEQLNHGNSVNGFKASIAVFDTTPGTKTLVIPEGWSKIRVAVIGAGAGGRENSNTTYGHGGGGGGGGYAEKVIDVAPGQEFSYVVGEGGIKNTDGGTSSFGGLISATGGSTGTVQSETAASAGGNGGTGIGGDINTRGGNGGSGYPATNGGGGGGGASGHRYGDGGNGGDGGPDDVPSNAPGGGGGGWGGPGGLRTNGPGLDRPLLFDDGWGLGISKYFKPLHLNLTVSNSNSLYFGMVGAGVSNRYTESNYGAGRAAIIGSTAYLTSAGVGGGGGGGYNLYVQTGGNGCVIVEVLELLA